MKPATVYNRYTLQMLDHQADWDVWAYWEEPRFLSMLHSLNPGDLLYDVGSEWGTISALYAQEIVGGESMVLIEPNPDLWPGIRMTWEANNLPAPVGCYVGLVGMADITHADHDTSLEASGWPVVSSGPEYTHRAYRYLHEHSTTSAQVTIDTLVSRFGIPAALTIDIEGAEAVALAGAVETLERHRPLVWVSVHPDLMRRDHYPTEKTLFSFMAELGYEMEHIHTDHEEHWVAWHPAGRHPATGRHPA